MYWDPHYINENATEPEGLGELVQGLISNRGFRIPLQSTPHTDPSHESTFILGSNRNGLCKAETTLLCVKTGPGGD